MWKFLQSYYNVFGGAAGQYPMYGGSTGLVSGTTSFYPYVQLGHGTGGPPATYPQPQGLQYPPLFHYSALNSTPFPQHYGGTSLPPPTSAGVFLFYAIGQWRVKWTRPHGCVKPCYVQANMEHMAWSDHTLLWPHHMDTRTTCGPVCLLESWKKIFLLGSPIISSNAVIHFISQMLKLVVPFLKLKFR